MSRDLIVLSSCTNSKFALQGIIESHAKLGIRRVTVDYVVHPNKDPGCLSQSVELLRAQHSRFSYALVVFDRDGCGQNANPDILEGSVKQSLESNGWSGRCEVVVIEPELDVWVWSDSPQVDANLGWFGRIPALRSWLADEGHWPQNVPKPPRPKEALEDALRVSKKRRTSKIYNDLAKGVSFQRCTDPAFNKLCNTLRLWFAV